jgi:hypothetical protein
MRRYLGGLVAIGLLASCSDGNNPGAPEEVIDLTTLTVARCAPESAGSATMTIGRDGGTLTLGHHTFVVPRRSLKEDVEITMQVGTDSTSSVTFFPEGLKFKKSKPAVLTLSYVGCEFGSDTTTVPAPASRRSSPPDHDDHDHSGHGHGQAPGTTGIVFIDGNMEIQEYLPSTIDSTAHTVTAEVEHFSRYAVAW